MPEITDWEPSQSDAPLDKEASLIKSNIEYRGEIRILQDKIKTLEAQHAKALQQANNSYTSSFRAFKTDVLVTLKALELVAIASQRHGQIALNHRERDARLAHLQTIITNAIADFSDRSFDF